MTTTAAGVARRYVIPFTEGAAAASRPKIGPTTLHLNPLQAIFRLGHQINFALEFDPGPPRPVDQDLSGLGSDLKNVVQCGLQIDFHLVVTPCAWRSKVQAWNET